MFRRPPVGDDLATIPLLTGLSNKELSLVSRLSTTVHVPVGRTLAQQGDVGAEFFMVVEGQVDVIRHGEVIATRGPGAHLGEIALLGTRPRTATLLTTTPVRARVASQREFSGLVRAVPAFAERLHATMAERLAA